MADNFNISDTPESAGPKSVEVPGDIADGTAGELMTWDAAGVASLVATGSATEVLTSNGAGAEPTFQAGGGAPVSSVFTRIGAVVAVASDYDASQVDNDSGVAGAFVDDALDNLAAAIPPAAPVDSVFTRTGAVVAAASDYDAGQVDNDSSIAGAFVDDALNNLDNAVALAQRTTDFAVPTAFGDVTLDTTLVETNSAIVDHDLAGSTDNIIAGVAGTYEIHYQFSIGPTQDTNSVAIVEARVRVNDTTVIPGSELHEYVFNDSSIESDDIAGFLSGTVVVALAATDFVTLQVNQIEQDGSPTPDILADTITLSMKRLTQ